MENRYWIYLVFIIIIPYLVNKYMVKTGYNQQRINVGVISTIVIAITTCTITDIIGTKQHGYTMGHFFEHGNYDAKFYVYVSDDEDSSKSYRLPADIRRSLGNYYFVKAYWPNGGTLSFYEPVKFYRGICFPADENDKEWRIELTDFPVHNFQ